MKIPGDHLVHELTPVSGPLWCLRQESACLVVHALRVQQAVTVASSNLPPHLNRPTDALAQHVMGMNFPGGLALTPGSSFEWHVQIDGHMPFW